MKEALDASVSRAALGDERFDRIVGVLSANPLAGHAGDALNDAFETFNVLNASFRASQQPGTFALPLNRRR